MAKAEIWKDVPGYEGKYMVSTLGNVKNAKRFSAGGYVWKYERGGI